jgi:hypothetical protein
VPNDQAQYRTWTRLLRFIVCLQGVSRFKLQAEHRFAGIKLAKPTLGFAFNLNSRLQQESGYR